MIIAVSALPADAASSNGQPLFVRLLCFGPHDCRSKLQDPCLAQMHTERREWPQSWFFLAHTCMYTHTNSHPMAIGVLLGLTNNMP